MLRSKLFIVLVLAFLPIIVCFFAIHFSLSYPINVLLIYLAPGIAIGLYGKKYGQMLYHALFAVIVSFPFAVIVDYIGIKSNIWFVPHSIFASRFLGVIPFEDFFWIASGVFTIISLYTFFRRQKENLVFNRKVGYFIVVSAAALILFYFITRWRQDVLIWEGKFSYLILASVFFLFPAIIFLGYLKNLRTHFWKVALYFLFITFILEATETCLGQWEFNGQYLVRQFTFLGNHHFPFEELFFVGIVGATAAAGFYEYFISKKDNRLGM